MTQLGEAFVPIRATLDKLDADLAQARGKMEGVLGSVASNMQKVGTVALAGVVAGVTALAAAVGVAGKAVFDLGATFDNAFDTIAVKTGATGAELEGLKEDFKAVFTSVPTDAGTASEAIATLNQRLGLTGEPLQDVSKKLLEMSRLLGTDVTASAELFGRVMADAGIPVDDAGGLLDKLFVASQASGVGIDSLMAKVVQFGAPMRLMGFTLDDSIALFAKWEKEGVNAELVMGSLRIAAGKFASAGQPLRDSLLETFNAIQTNTDASAALALGMEVFGARAGPDMVAAIREGRFEFEDLAAALESSDGAILNTAANTADFAEKWTLLKNNVMTALEPVGTAIFGLAGTILDNLTPAFDGILPVLEGVSNAIATFTGLITSGTDPLAALSYLVYQLGLAFGLNRTEAAGVSGAFTEIVGKIQEFIAQAQEVLEPIIAAVSQFVSWQDVLAALGIAIASVIIPIIISLIATIAPIIATFALVTAAVALLRNAWENNWGGIRDKTQAVIDYIKPLVENAIKSIQEWWAENGDKLLAKAKEIWETIQTTIDTVINTVKEIIADVTALIQHAWDRHGDEILASATGFWEAVKFFIESNIKKIQKIITDVSDAIKKFWDRHGEQIQEGAQKAWDKIQEIIDLAFKQISIFFDAFAKLFKGDWAGFLDEIGNLWLNGLLALAHALEGLWAILSPILVGIFKDITGWFDTQIKEFAKIGNNLITSLADAISNKANSYLKKVAQGVANLLPEWVKDILGISSPSKVFQKIGDQVGLGLAMGIEDSTGGVRQALEALFGELGGPGDMGVPFFSGLGMPTYDMDSLLPGAALAGVDASGPFAPSYSSTTTIYTNRDPMRVLRASRHLDKLGTLP